MNSHGYASKFLALAKLYLSNLLVILIATFSLVSLSYAQTASTTTKPSTSATPVIEEHVKRPGNERFLDQPDMFGYWSQSPTLQRLGIAPSVSLTSDIQGNPGGGISHGFRQFTNIFAGVAIDLQKLIGAPETKFYASFSERFGTSLTNINIGNAFNVAQVCCGSTYRVVDVYLEQPFYKNHFNLRAGRIATGDEFLSSPLYWFFVQNGIDGNPVGIFKNAPGMTAYPTATWGARARVTFVKEVDVMLGAFNGDPTLGLNNKHGLDWSNRGPGFYIGEFGYHPNKGSDTALPGNYKAGIYYDNAIFTNFLHDSNGGIAALSGLPYATRRGNTGYYLLFDQMVYRQGSGSKNPRGLTPFISYLVAPNAAYNVMPYFLNGGLVYQGPFNAREEDVAGFAFVYGTFSNTQREAQRITNPTASTQNSETVLELFYLFQVAKWLKVQPDVQYIFNPNGTNTIPNATVLGGQLAITF